ncbi:MAG: DUF1858 domain-containing protein [Anaerolineae bacterium]|jgi:hypothetical protein|nr:DUF1858 domain-containing protein [Anaerolineae bacterium]
MEITGRSKLFDVLREYPSLEEKIIDIAPAFKNLRNPVLRRTVGQLATIEKVAQVGNVDADQLVNTLRRAVGQPELGAAAPAPIGIPAAALDDPEWIAGEPQFVLDGTSMLQRGEVPVQTVNELLPQINGRGYILLVTDFEPAPIIDAMTKARRRVHHKLHPSDATQHLTYIAS